MPRGRKRQCLDVFSAVGDNSPLSLVHQEVPNDWREVQWVIRSMGVGELMMCSQTWGLCSENGWMWLIPSNRNRQWSGQWARRKSSGYVATGECVLKVPLLGLVCVFLSGCSSGQCCFFLIPEAVWLLKRDSWGDWLSLHVRLRIKQKP